jgi:N-methylhydantoinase B/oxoprolinase/acetone carboxylase alpha subunit
VLALTEAATRLADRGCDSVEVTPGDRFVPETPGGGGYGIPSRGAITGLPTTQE